jgi:hypothetical protein
MRARALQKSAPIFFSTPERSFPPLHFPPRRIVIAQAMHELRKDGLDQ